MKPNIFSKPGVSQGLFRDERLLYPEFVPERLPHRDKEIEELVFALKPIVSGKKPANVFVSGSTGTGKTVTVKYVLKELQEYTDRARGIFINCFEYGSRHAILSHVSNSIGAPVPRRGTGSDEVIARVASVLKNSALCPVIVLDESDQLVRRDDASRLFYDILRMAEHEKARFGVVFISNDPAMTAGLDDRVRSSLFEHKVSFEKYTAGQLSDILNERIPKAFMGGVIGKDVIELAVAHAAKNGGDARVAIECVLKAGRIAEKENSRIVGIEHVKKAVSMIVPRAAEKAMPFVSDEERKVLGLLSGETTTGNLYSAYKKSGAKPLTLRRFRDVINSLEAKGLVNVKPVSLPRGRTRTISKK